MNLTAGPTPSATDTTVEAHAAPGRVLVPSAQPWRGGRE
jgi:hypothetical protein